LLFGNLQRSPAAQPTDVVSDGPNRASGGAPGASAPGGRSIPMTEREFRNRDPNYQERVGVFYEQAYLPTAISQLAKAASLTESEIDAARGILRTFSYDFLECYVRGGARISKEDLNHCLTVMDERMHGAMSPAGYASYLVWRKAEDRTKNALAFLMSPRPEVLAAPATKPATLPIGGAADNPPAR
jgi:hypothetical protein